MGALEPQSSAIFVQILASAPIEDQREFLDLVDKGNAEQKRRNTLRFAAGGVAGLVAGLLVAKLRKRK